MPEYSLLMFALAAMWFAIAWKNLEVPFLLLSLALTITAMFTHYF